MGAAPPTPATTDERRLGRRAAVRANWPARAKARRKAAEGVVAVLTLAYARTSLSATIARGRGLLRRQRRCDLSAELHRTRKPTPEQSIQIQI